MLFSLPIFSAQAAETASAVEHPLTLGEYRQQLQRVQQSLNSLDNDSLRARDLRESLPDYWRVQTGQRSFDISNRPLQTQLERFQTNREDRAQLLGRMQQAVSGELAEAIAFDQPIDTSAGPKLDAILQQKEFRSLSRNQSPLERWKDRLLGWLVRFLGGLFRSATRHPELSRILMWTLIGLITVALAIWVKVLVTRASPDEYAFPPSDHPLAPSHKPWQRWLSEARSAGERGNWREAVHLSYWAAISYLESSGAWRPDRARTPREYLRLLPDASARREPLSDLTRRFELVWYAQRDATRDDFDRTLAQLERIGCR